MGFITMKKRTHHFFENMFGSLFPCKSKQASDGTSHFRHFNEDVEMILYVRFCKPGFLRSFDPSILG